MIEEKLKLLSFLERASNLLESQETERLKTELLAAEVEIARLQSALDEIRLYVIDSKWNDEDNTIYIPSLLHEINRIIGTDK